MSSRPTWCTSGDLSQTTTEGSRKANAWTRKEGTEIDPGASEPAQITQTCPQLCPPSGNPHSSPVSCPPGFRTRESVSSREVSGLHFTKQCCAHLSPPWVAPCCLLSSCFCWELGCWRPLKGSTHARQAFYSWPITPGFNHFFKIHYIFNPLSAPPLHVHVCCMEVGRERTVL